MSETYTLYTRSNFDGLVCAALLKEVGIIDKIQFVHPKDIQDGKVQLDNNVITASLPYTEGVYMAFDHHSSEAVRTREVKNNYIIEPAAPSSARIIYEYFGGDGKFPPNLYELMEAVDIADCSNYSTEDILNPKDWVLLNYLMDPRTGLGRYKRYRISNYSLMEKLVDLCANKSIQEIMEDPDVKERIDIYFLEQESFIEQIKRCTKVEDNIAILDVRGEDVVHIGNRFMLYALFPNCNISIHAFWGKQKQNTVLAVGKSVVNRSCSIDIGAMLYQYSGGGHVNAGTCQISNDKADATIDILKTQIIQLGS